MKTLITAAAALAASAFSAAPAVAQTPDRTVVVRFADLDLSTRAGQASLDRRLASAVTYLCGTPSAADPDGRRTVRACRTDLHAAIAPQRAAALATARVEIALSR